MKTTFMLVPLFLLGGCTATIVARREAIQSPYAPVNNVQGGTVAYYHSTNESLQRTRRLDAFKKMHDYCNGPYRILTEGKVEHFEETNWEIEFNCVPAQ